MDNYSGLFLVSRLRQSGKEKWGHPAHRQGALLTLGTPC